MPQLRIAAVLALAIILQLSLGAVSPRLVYVDFPLVVVVYIALQHDAGRALIAATVSGLVIDAVSGGIFGSGGFSKTLTAFMVYLVATRVNLDNPLLRIPVLASAAAMNAAVYVGVHRLLQQPSSAPFVRTLSFQVIGTTVAGTLVILMLDNLLSDKARQRRQFADRRRVAKRGTGSLKRR